MITTELEYEAALKEAEALIELDPPPGSKKGDRLEVLTFLISKYEEDHFPMELPSPIDAIKFSRKMNRATKKIIKNFSEDTKRILKDNLVSGYLFGSIARDDASEFSDIDILFIVQNFDYGIRKELSRLASEYSINYGVCISPVVKDVKIWGKNRIYKTLFYQEIQRDGMQIC